MNPLGFGRHVLVHALAMRVLGYKDGDVHRYKNPQAADVPWFDAATVGEWPGDPIHLEWDLPKAPGYPLEPIPNGKAIVRWRRLPLDHPHAGIVVGTTYKYEGVVEDSGMSGPKRSVSVYQCALAPTTRSAKAMIVFVHPKDVQIVEEHERGVPAPSRVGVGGRIGGGRLGGG